MIAPEAWWIEVTPTRYGYEAIAKNAKGGVFGQSVEGFFCPLWRPTEAWARRAVQRGLRRYLEGRRQAALRDDATRIYPVEL